MSNIRVMWGADGCDEIIKQLNSLKSAVKSMETELPEHLARVGQNSAEAKTASVGVMGLDGNQLGGFYILEHTDYVELVNQGEDVAFIEFGTGMMGQQSPHPLAGEAGWEYYTPTRYKRSVGGRKGWFYKNKLTGELKVGTVWQIPHGALTVDVGLTKGSIRKLSHEAGVKAIFRF